MSCCGWHQDKATAPSPEADVIPPVPAGAEQTLVLPPALPNPNGGPSEGELQPLHLAALPPAPVRSCPGSEVYSSERRAAAAACSPACLLPPAPGIQPSLCHCLPGQSPPAWGRNRPRGAGIARRHWCPLSPAMSHLSPYPRATESACSPWARQVSPAPAASARL